MKFTIEGFSQKFAMTLKKEVNVGGRNIIRKIDCTDLVILRWFVDFYPNMKKIQVDGKEYAWLTHKKLQEDLPIVDISKRSFIDRMQKLVDFEILDYKLIKEGGTFSLYGFGKNYMNLIQSREGMQSNNIGSNNQTPQGMQPNASRGMQSNGIGAYNQTANKDNSIIYPSISDTSNNIIKDIVAYLNVKANKKFKASSSETKKHIHARLEEGFTLDEFKTVVDKKCIDWIGTDYEQYLRPSTLFGTKFEGYLNAPVKEKKTYGKTGIEIKQVEEDDLAEVF